MKTLLLFFIIFNEANLKASSADEPDLKRRRLATDYASKASDDCHLSDLRELSPRLYVSSRTTDQGETTYFCFETLDTQKSREKWAAYKQACLRLCSPPDGGVLIRLGLNLDNPTECNRIRNSSHFVDMTDTEFDQLLRHMRHQGLYESKDNHKWRALIDIRTAAYGFHPTSVSHQACCKYVAYVSKVPILEPIDLPSQTPATIKSIFDTYRDIVMSVGVYTDITVDQSGSKPLKHLPIYENRGIFRNPICLIDGGYKSLSIPLHIFTANVFSQFLGAAFIEQKKFLRVSPLPKMADMIISAIGKKHVLIGKDIPKDFFVTKGYFEQTLLIKIEHLTSIL